MSRRHNPARAKLHLSYTILEIASLYQVEKGTVSNWISAGLATVDRKRPLLVTGVALRAFIKGRMDATKRPSLPGEIFCVACKATKRPAGRVVNLEPVSTTSANIIGTCPDCSRRIYRRVRFSNLLDACGGLSIAPKDRDDTCNTEA